MKLFLLPSSMSLISGVFPQWHAGTSPLDSQTSTKALSPVGNDQNQCPMGGRQWKTPIPSFCCHRSPNLCSFPTPYRSDYELCDAIKGHWNARHKPTSASYWLPDLWKVEASSLSKSSHLLNTF